MIRIEEDHQLRAGNIVHLLDDKGDITLDKDGLPCLYQVLSVYRELSKVGLVTSYKESIGRYDFERVVYVSEGPMFRSDEYDVGSVVTWVDHDGVYEGVIDTLYSSLAKMKNVKKLMPIDYTVRVPYWKLSKDRESLDSTSSVSNNIGDDLKSKERLPMSTKANIIFRNESTIRREIVLYKHADAHPNNMTLYLAEMLRDAYLEFKELGDMDWFLDPSKLASFLVVKSVPQITDDVKALLRQLPESARYQLESAYFLGMPHFLVENGRVPNCNYEYIVTLSENVEENFFGYELEVNKLHNNKLISTTMKHRENLLRESSNKKTSKVSK